MKFSATGLLLLLAGPAAPWRPFPSKSFRFRPFHLRSFPLGFQRALRSFWNLLLSLDCTCGAYEISSPLSSQVFDNSTVLATVSLEVIPKTSTFPARVHQLGKSAVKRLPDHILLGSLLLISTELLKRELVNKPTYPLALRELVDSTLRELDSKIQQLSAFNWEFDPFLRAELLRLQTQPLEVIDRYITSEILPGIDKEVAPYLMRLTKDPKTVTAGIEYVKELIQLISFVIVKYEQKPSLIHRSTVDIIKHLDVVGARVENGNGSDQSSFYFTK